MAHQLSGHLWSAAILVASASVALAAERCSASPRPIAAGDAGVGDLSGFVSPLRSDTLFPRWFLTIPVDPFDSYRAPTSEPSVASAAATPTVPSSGRTLTAILIADERRVAVIDDTAVSIGDVLRDGARVSAIQPDRVFVVEKNGRWKMLTLTNREH